MQARTRTPIMNSLLPHFVIVGKSLATKFDRVATAL
jgi:hypothetical protein